MTYEILKGMSGIVGTWEVLEVKGDRERERGRLQCELIKIEARK